MRNLYWSIGLAVVAGTTASVVWGATYNVYFNNTEQGANSTASPSLTVSGDGKATSTGAQQTLVSKDGKLVPANATDEQKAAPVSTTQNQAEPTDTPSSGLKHFRFGLGAARLASRSDLDSGANPLAANAAVGELGFIFTRELGVNFFGGVTGTDSGSRWFGGGELEVTPIHASLFRMEDALELTALAGASTMRTLYDEFASTAAAVHVGVRASLNLGRQYGVTAVVRDTVGPGSAGGNLMAEAGLIVRL